MSWGWILGGAAALGTGIYLYRLNNFSQNLETLLNGRIHKIGFDGITTAINAQLKNPTKTGVTIKFPFVKIMYNGKTLATSQSVNQDVKIPQFGEALVSDIMVKLPYSALLLNAAELYNNIREQKPIVIQAKVTTYIKTLAGLQPYESTQNITLV